MNDGHRNSITSVISLISYQVQSLVSNIKMYNKLLSTIPAFVCVSFLGPLSDQVLLSPCLGQGFISRQCTQVGRKPCMLMPFIGHTLIAGLLMLNVYFSHWPVEATLAEAMWGIFGGGYFSVSS